MAYTRCVNWRLDQNETRYMMIHVSIVSRTNEIMQNDATFQVQLGSFRCNVTQIHWFFLSEARVHVIRSKALQGPLDRLPHILLKRSGLFPRNVYQIDSKAVKQNTKWCSMTFIASLEFWSPLWNRCRLHVSFALFILKNQDFLLVSSPSTRRAKVTCTLAICSKSTRDQNWKLKIVIKYKMHS